MQAVAALSPLPGLAWLAPFRMDEFAPPAPAAPLSLPPANPALQGWLLAVAEQDEAAFARLYEALAPRVLLLAQRILRNPACAEEVVEDCFWQVWRQAARFDPARGCAEAWVMTLARSRALDTWRSRERHQALSLDELEDAGTLLAEPADARHDAEALVDASRHHRRLHEALQHLKPEARQLLALAFFRGLTHEEIAEQCGMALGTVKSQIRRALASLNPVLRDAGASP